MLRYHADAGPQSPSPAPVTRSPLPDSPAPETAASNAPVAFLAHPALAEVQRLLAIAPELERLDIRDDEVRIIAGAYALRRLAEEATERLIELLDELEADPDLEDGGDAEPSTGPCYADEHEPPEDDERWLGWTHAIDQTSAAWQGEPRSPWSVVDGEAGDDNGIADAGGLDFDAEDDGTAEECEPSGIGDQDGLAEQLHGEPEEFQSDPTSEDEPIFPQKGQRDRPAAEDALGQLRGITEKVDGPELHYVGRLRTIEVLGPDGNWYRATAL